MMMNKKIGQGECSKCGRRGYAARTLNSDQRFECPYCDAGGEWLDQGGELGNILGPPVFHGLPEFIIPQYEKDQGFSEAFRDALAEFLKVGKRHMFHFSNGADAEEFIPVSLWYGHPACITYVSPNNARGIRGIGMRDVDRIVLCPDQGFDLTPEVTDEEDEKYDSPPEPLRPEVCGDCIRKGTRHCIHYDTFWPEDCHLYQRKEPILPLGLLEQKVVQGVRTKAMDVWSGSPVKEGDIVKCVKTGWEYRIGNVISVTGGCKRFSVVSCIGKDIPTHIADKSGISRMNTAGFLNCDEPGDSEMIDSISDSSVAVNALKKFSEQPSLAEAFNYPEETTEDSTEPSGPHYPRWTDLAREVLKGAKKCARERRHKRVTPYHLLYEITQARPGIAYRVLYAVGDLTSTTKATAARLRAEGEANSSCRPEMSSALKEVIVLSGKIASEMSCSYVGTEHLLLGLSRWATDNEPEMCGILRAKYDDIYKEVREFLGIRPEEQQMYTLDEIIDKINGQYLARRLVWPDSIRMKILDRRAPFIFDSDPENQHHTFLNLMDIQATDWVIVGVE